MTLLVLTMLMLAAFPLGEVLSSLSGGEVAPIVASSADFKPTMSVPAECG